MQILIVVNIFSAKTIICEKIKNATYAYLNFEFSNKHSGPNLGVWEGGGS